MADTENRPMYGIWQPGFGWIRGNKGAVFADYSIEKTYQVARLIGQGAKVRYIDESIVDLENLYLSNERRNLWHIFNNWWRNKISKLHSNR